MTDLSPSVVARLESLAAPLSAESLEATPADIRDRLADTGMAVAELLREMGKGQPSDIASQYEEISGLVSERYESFAA